MRPELLVPRWFVVQHKGTVLEAPTLAPVYRARSIGKRIGPATGGSSLFNLGHDTARIPRQQFSVRTIGQQIEFFEDDGPN